MTSIEFLNVLAATGTAYRTDSECSTATVYCPTCKAGIGARCRNKTGKVMKRAHSDRNQRMFRLSVRASDDVLVGFVQTAKLNGDTVTLGYGTTAAISGVSCTLDAWTRTDEDTVTVLARFRDNSRRVLQLYRDELVFGRN